MERSDIFYSFYGNVVVFATLAYIEVSGFGSDIRNWGNELVIILNVFMISFIPSPTLFFVCDLLLY